MMQLDSSHIGKRFRRLDDSVVVIAALSGDRLTAFIDTTPHEIPGKKKYDSVPVAELRPAEEQDAEAMGGGAEEIGLDFEL